MMLDAKTFLMETVSMRKHFDPSCQHDDAVVTVSNDPVSGDVSTDGSGMGVEDLEQMQFR